MNAEFKTVPVYLHNSFTMWHLLYGPNDGVFPCRYSGYKTPIEVMDAAADHNMGRRDQGLHSIGMQFHIGGEVGVHEKDDAKAKALNQKRSTPWSELRAWLDDETRSNYDGTSEITAVPIAAFGHESWGLGGSYASDDEAIRNLTRDTWTELAKMIAEGKDRPWGKCMYALDWNGNNSEDPDDSDKFGQDDIITNDYILKSVRHQRMFEHWRWWYETHGLDITGEPKIDHPGLMPLGTAELGVMTATKFNQEVADGEPAAVVLLEDCHTLGHGEKLMRAHQRTVESRVMVRRNGYAAWHPNGGIFNSNNIGKALGGKGIKRGDIDAPRDLDQPFDLVTSEVRADSDERLKFLVQNLGLIPKSWTTVDYVVLDAGHDVRHGGCKQTLTKQIQSITALESRWIEAGGLLMPL